MTTAGPGGRRSLGRRILAPTVVLSMLILGQAAFLFFTRTPPPVEPAMAARAVDADPVRIAAVTGGVRIEASIGTRTARENEPLRIGDRITTGPDGRAEIELVEVGSILLDVNSTLERTNADGRGQDYFLHAGGMLIEMAAVDIRERPVFHTPHATFLPDTGTENEFLVQAEP